MLVPLAQAGEQWVQREGETNDSVVSATDSHTVFRRRAYSACVSRKGRGGFANGIGQ